MYEPGLLNKMINDHENFCYEHSSEVSVPNQILIAFGKSRFLQKGKQIRSSAQGRANQMHIALKANFPPSGWLLSAPAVLTLRQKTITVMIVTCPRLVSGLGRRRDTGRGAHGWSWWVFALLLGLSQDTIRSRAVFIEKHIRTIGGLMKRFFKRSPVRFSRKTWVFTPRYLPSWAIFKEACSKQEVL